MNTPIIDPSTLTEEQINIIKKYISRPFADSMSETYYALGMMDTIEWLFGKDFFEKGE